LVLPQLGSVPKPATPLSAVKSELIKLQAVEISKKKEDTCPNCGAFVDLSDGKSLCPSCGGVLILPEIKIGELDSSKQKPLEEGKCPYCKKKITDLDSQFCPYCGKPIEGLQTVSAPKEIIEKTPAQEFSESIESAGKIIKFFVPDNLQYAIFNGAAILGSLESFRSLFIISFYNI
jgi:uncharacterized Zn finger protein (UPF0148 family)